jgi:hypothetical protein
MAKLLLSRKTEREGFQGVLTNRTFKDSQYAKGIERWVLGADRSLKERE